ncbi:hypothetical protein Bca101_072826 [Brassica carinata]
MAIPIRFLTLALVILSVLLLSSSLGGVTAKETKRSEAEVQRMYERWLVENRKNYNALGEKERRFNIFKDNLKLIEAHNSVPERTYELGLTRFADLTDDEFRAIHLRGKMVRTSDPVIGDRYLYKEGDVLPDEVDWRKVQLFRSKIKETVMVTTRYVTIDSYEDAPHNDEMSLKKAVAHQPISVMVEAENMKLYKSGVFTGPCDHWYGNHNVVVVGYGTTERGEDYWIIRNSWGANWGESGYITLQRNFHNSTGNCGVAIRPVYPLKSNSAFGLLSPSMFKLGALIIFQLIGWALF